MRLHEKLQVPKVKFTQLSGTVAKWRFKRDNPQSERIIHNGLFCRNYSNWNIQEALRRSQQRFPPVQLVETNHMTPARNCTGG